ncbi:hypothetical protein H4R22_002103 [Coemansia sp. RSA 1290]|nr:hypothetical protein H4R22_002103 [Coemansia sp. RSA 1290]
MTTRAYPQSVYEEIRSLKTSSDPSQSQPLPQPVQLLRARVECSSWAQQITSGIRQDVFTQTATPGSLLVRIKTRTQKYTPKTKPMTRRLVSIDELEYYSRGVGKSSYLPLSARGTVAFATEHSLRKVRQLMGYIRPDLVEHCSRVLRLGLINSMHRSLVQFIGHSVQAPQEEPCANRLQMIRNLTNNRFISQDTLWPGPSIFTPLSPPIEDIQSFRFTATDRLPPGGLQCIVKLPVPTNPGSKYSVSSEPHAREIWKAALPKNHLIEQDILDGTHQWKAFVMSGRPEPRRDPVLTLYALEKLYHLLPRLTPESMDTPDAAALIKKVRKFKHPKRVAALGHKVPVLKSFETELVKPVLLSQPALIEYQVSQQGESDSQLYKQASKTVPLYDLRALFGDSIAASVAPWLMGIPVNTEHPDFSNPAMFTEKYFGLVALPCTAQLATSLHRATIYSATI